jgi:hypothetical protein
VKALRGYVGKAKLYEKSTWPVQAPKKNMREKRPGPELKASQSTSCSRLTPASYPAMLSNAMK